MEIKGEDGEEDPFRPVEVEEDEDNEWVDEE